jgi:hypothetical protein
MKTTSTTVSVSRQDLDEAISILDGLASALAMARRDWDGQASRAAEAVARIGAVLRPPDSELDTTWRQTLIGALGSGLDSHTASGTAIIGLASEAS